MRWSGTGYRKSRASVQFTNDPEAEIDGCAVAIFRVLQTERAVLDAVAVRTAHDLALVAVIACCAVGDPFGDIADEIVNALRARRKSADFGGVLESVFAVVALAQIQVAAIAAVDVAEFACCRIVADTDCSSAPFACRRQPVQMPRLFRQPGGVSARVVEADANDRMPIVLIEPRRAPGHCLQQGQRRADLPTALRLTSAVRDESRVFATRDFMLGKRNELAAGLDDAQARPTGILQGCT